MLPQCSGPRRPHLRQHVSQCPAHQAVDVRVEGVMGTLPAPDLSTHPMASDCDTHPCRPNGMRPPSTIRIQCTQPPPSDCNTHKSLLSKHDAQGARRTTHEGTTGLWRRGIVPPVLQSTHAPNTDALDLQTEGFIFSSHLYSCVQGGAKQTFVCSRRCDRSR
jgi:hypothetical protein